MNPQPHNNWKFIPEAWTVPAAARDRKIFIWRIKTKIMKKYWFIFCKTDIMLEKAEDSFSIPLSEDCPIPLHPWTHVLNITPMEDGTEVKAVMIDQPVTDYPQYEMCGLRPFLLSSPQ